jgi:16S rRNA G527 N7-methylase RsmG
MGEDCRKRGADMSAKTDKENWQARWNAAEAIWKKAADELPADCITSRAVLRAARELDKLRKESEART